MQLEGGSRLSAGGLALTAGAVLKVKDNCWLRSQESLNVLNLFSPTLKGAKML